MIWSMGVIHLNFPHLSAFFFYPFALYLFFMQKNIIFNFLSLSIVLFFYGCLNKPNVETESGPEIHLSQPLNNDTLINDSILFLNLIVGDINGVHDVDISIYNENFSELNYNKFSIIFMTISLS